MEAIVYKKGNNNRLSKRRRPLNLIHGSRRFGISTNHEAMPPDCQRRNFTTSHGGGVKTIEARIVETHGRTSGFDYMRLALASGVIAMHSVITSYGQLAEIAFWQSPIRPVIRLILPMFFALSGFLVAGSLERAKTLGGFLGLRAIRILPALAVEVVLSAFIIGAIFTTLPLAKYYIDPLFFRYFFNIIGHIQYHLPGVFETNPLPKQVNNQLWTVPFELYCYAILATLALLGIRRWQIMGPVTIVALSAVYLAYRLLKFPGGDPIVIGPLTGYMLIVCFLCGVTLYQYRDRLPYTRATFWAALLLSVILVWFVPFGDFLAPLPIAYLTVYLGLQDPKRWAIIRGADYSYGMFLYGYVIQQMIAALGPWAHHWLLNAALALAIAAAFAAFSWHLVEKPALKLRGPLMRSEAWWKLLRAPARTEPIAELNKPPSHAEHSPTSGRA
jgi:peptidoglycan/LPS O-acetylase OafA/YrhL